MKELKDRIAWARKRKKLTPAELARRIGVQPAAIYQLESGESKSLKGETLIALADVLGVNANWLQTGKGDWHRVSEDHAIVRFHRKARAKAGAGYINEEPAEYGSVGGIAFLRDSLVSRGLEADACESLRVHGKSMLPTLRPDDTILFNSSEQRIVSGKLYVLDIAEGTIVKRLFVEQDGRIRVSSDERRAGRPGCCGGEHVPQAQECGRGDGREHRTSEPGRHRLQRRISERRGVPLRVASEAPHVRGLAL